MEREKAEEILEESHRYSRRKVKMAEEKLGRRHEVIGETS